MRQRSWLQVLAAAGAAILVLVLILVSCFGGDEAARTVKVGVAYDLGGPGDKSINDATAAGVRRVNDGLDLHTKELEAMKYEPDVEKYARLKLLCDSGYDPVIAVGSGYAGVDPANGPLARAAKDCPKTKFAIVDDASVKSGNVANLVFAEEQGSFLVGAAAALKSRTGYIGFVGGCPADRFKKLQAGYEAGARTARADIKIDVRNLSPVAGRCSDSSNHDEIVKMAEGLYDGGADVIYQAVGGSGVGVFQAAKAKGRWAIGVGSDWYHTVDVDLRDVIVTSMVKRVDTAVSTFVKETTAGKFKAGVNTFDLKRDCLGYSTSGGKVEDVKSRLDDYQRQIVDGKISVPTQPGG